MIVKNKYLGSEDSDMEDIETPLSPPEKPANLVTFYIVENRGGGLSDEDLRTEFREKIGQQEKQKWKQKWKKVKKRYQKLLQLFVIGYIHYLMVHYPKNHGMILVNKKEQKYPKNHGMILLQILQI